MDNDEAKAERLLVEVLQHLKIDPLEVRRGFDAERTGSRRWEGTVLLIVARVKGWNDGH
jgi:hypothetical protein